MCKYDDGTIVWFKKKNKCIIFAVASMICFFGEFFFYNYNSCSIQLHLVVRVKSEFHLDSTNLVYVM